MLKDFSMKNVQNCLRFMGNLFGVNDEMCSHYVQNMNFLDQLKRVFTYCTKTTRKEALWVLSNIAANSEGDAVAIANHQLVINLFYACRDNSFEIRKEAIWTLSNILYQVTDKEVMESLINLDIVTILLERL